MNGLVLARKIRRKILGIPPVFGSYVVALPTVEARLDGAYRDAQIRHRHRLPDLPASDLEIVRALNEKGVYITSLQALGIPQAEEMLAAGQKLAKGYEALHKAGALRDRDAFQASAADVIDNKVIFYWGLNERLLKIAEAYIGLPVAYDGVNVFYTKSDGRQVSARKWHRDIEDRRMVKIAVYFNEVDEGGGPLQILNHDLPAETLRSKARPPVHTHEMLEARFGRTLDEADITTCKGPAGTVVFCDTAQKYHRGKPAISRDRCAVFFNYFSRVPLRPFFCERSTLSRSQIKMLSEGLSPAQRDALLWRDQLPLLSRLIPPEPVA